LAVDGRLSSGPAGGKERARAQPLLWA
jgi:hypothetical protein